MAKRSTDNIMAKRSTDNTMVKRSTDNAMAKRKRRTKGTNDHLQNTWSFCFVVKLIINKLISIDNGMAKYPNA
jgi:hypothetical protein